jgi:hypothetical protein
MCLVFITYILWLRQGRSLDPQIIPTAEFLAQNPSPLPYFINYIDPPPGETLLSGQQICLTINPGELMRPEDIYDRVQDFVAWNTTFTINEQPLPFYTPAFPEFPAGMYKIIEGQETGVILYCFTPDLEMGLHLAELHTKDLSGKNYSYSWAFRVQ